MNRRSWLRWAAGSGALLLAGGGAGTWWLAGPQPPVARFPDTPAALAWLETLLRRPARSITEWTLAQVLEHAAQSVEYSLDGYPELRSSAFRSSIGRLAFLTFSRRGHTAHSTIEPIPGAPPLVEIDVAAAARRLARALLRFEATPPTHAFPPHFAYGALDKDEYRRAHLMHLAEHADEVVFD